MAPALAQPVDSKAATPAVPDQAPKAKKVPEANLDLAAVDEFFKAMEAKRKTDPEASSSEGYGFERGVWWMPACERSL